MDSTLFHIVRILGSLALFIYGMKVMSDGVQRAAGTQLRDTFRNVTKNRFIGFLTGLVSTSLIQSSSATTVMTVSFVNAGLMTLKESVGIMMGANVGTTTTAWLVATLGFKFPIINSILLPFLALGVPFSFSKKSNLKYWGEFLIGFSLLFLGLEFLKESFPEMTPESPLYEMIINFTDSGFVGTVVFVLLGAILTLLFQSSSAAMILTITMCAKGWISFENGAAMVLGENLGTTITAELAALVGNVHAKRSARIHSLFNLVGVLWMIILLPQFVKFIGWLNVAVFKFGDPFQNQDAVGLGIAAFHTSFNILNAALLIGFVPFLITITKMMIKPKSDKNSTKLTHISTNVFTPELATVELKKRAFELGESVSLLNNYTYDLLNEIKQDKKSDLKKKIKAQRKEATYITKEVSQHIKEISTQEMTGRTNIRLLSIMDISNRLDSISNEYQSMVNTITKKNDEKIWFNQNQRDSINILLRKISVAFKVMLYNLSNDNYSVVSKNDAKRIKKEISIRLDNLKREQTSDIDLKEIHMKSVLVINDIITNLEKINDMIQNVTNSIRGKI